eukprot:9116999-Alexandrium_andersonii.AAC.1
MRTDDVKEQTLTDLKRKVGGLLSLYGGDRAKAREMAHGIIDAVNSDLQATEQEHTTPMESDG